MSHARLVAISALPKDDVLAAYPFEVERAYVIFAQFKKTEEAACESDLHPRTSWCSGNICLGDGESDVDLDKLSNDIFHREFTELETETALVERLKGLRLKLDEPDGSDKAKNNTENELARITRQRAVAFSQLISSTTRLASDLRLQESGVSY